MKKLSTYPQILVAVLIILSFSSCEYIIQENSTDAVYTNEITNERLEVDLIVQATQENLNTIALCNAIEKTNSDDELLEIVGKIKREQEEILKNLHVIAKENLILTAKKANRVSYSCISDQDTIANTTLFVSAVQTNLDVQKEVLNSLVRESDTEEIFLIAKESIKQLKENILITEETLESLK